MPKVVTIGGGNGQSCTLRALNFFLPQVQITSVVAVSDNGGSSGILREKFDILPVGDLLRAIMSLSSYPYLELREIFYATRFDSGELAGHDAGNLLLTMLRQLSGDWLQAIEAMSKILKVQGTIYPATTDLSHLCAELENGMILKGQVSISCPSVDCRLKKQRLWLEPAGKILPQARDAILSADFIILGSGDLYTSIIPSLLVDGMSEALRESRATLVFIPNVANRETGETCGFSVGDYVSELHKYLPRQVDWLAVQDEKVAPNLEHFNLKKWTPVEIDGGNWRREYKVMFHDLYAKNEAGMDWQRLVEPLGKVLGLLE